jgi:hypothetical protein
MTFELWSGSSGNLLGAFPNEGEAFAAVREAAETNGPAYVESLALIVEDDAGDSHLLAEGEDLIRRVAGRVAEAR